MHTILRQLRRAALLSVADGPSDAQLLDAFLSHRDEVAFEALVRRHGPMVLAVCRRVTGNAHDAEDAFQATFLVLLRKAASLRSGQVLPGWLHAVAYRTALNTRTMTKKRHAKEHQAAKKPSIQASDDGVPEELLTRLDEALNRLPDRYRVPVVLCELQGHSRKEAARLLGLPQGTLSWRLAHARKLLAQRLARYGTMLSAGAVAAVLSQNAASAVPAALVRAVMVQALAVGTIPAPIQALTEGVLKAMLLSKLKIVWGVALAFAVGAGAVGLMYRPAVAADPQQPGRGRASARASADELDELRLEIAALRKGLEVTRERVKTLEGEVATLRGHGAGALYGAWMERRTQMGGDGTMSPPSMDGSVPGIGTNPTRPTFPTKRGRQHEGHDDSPRLPRFGNDQAHDAGQKSPNQAPGKSDGAPTQSKGPPAHGNRQTSTAPSERAVEMRLYRATLEQARNAWLTQPLNRVPDPLAEAKAALKQLRNHPNDRQAADRLERALKRLEEERKKQPAGPQPASPQNR